MSAATAADSSAGELQLVIFQLGNEEYGMDISQVREIIRVGAVTRIPQSPEHVDGLINLRGQITSIINLRRKLGMETRPSDDNSRIIIVDSGGSLVGILVDYVAEVKSLSMTQVDPVPDALSSVAEEKFVIGVGKLTERLLILIDPQKLVAGI